MKTPAQTAHAIPFRVAVVGAGPSGCYAAQAMRKGQPDIEIAVFDSLPTPFGLIRYGIAPDHQGAKAVSRQFERVFAQQGVEFVGNVSVGTDIGFESLLDSFHAVVLATGLGVDRRLGIDQDPDARVVGAGDLIRLLNSDPDARLRHRPDGLHSLGSEVVILGTGNVAVDVARLLSKSDLDFIASDVDDDALRTMAPSPVRSIHILGRCQPHLAKWDASMVKELAQVVGVQVSIDGTPFLREPAMSPHTTVNVWFQQVPTSIRRHDGRIRVTTHRTGDRDQAGHLDADTVITALGFDSSSAQLAQFARLERSNVFRVGGPATGRLGNLADNRKLAADTAKGVLAFLRGQEPRHRPGLDGLRGRLPASAVSFQAWQRIDDAEIRRARPDRCRSKFTTRDGLLAAAAGSDALPSIPLATTGPPATQEK
ncbi:FAD-dependent oxidoreductase [Streptomyces sp. WI04-05B]|uniref:FAD-dependent oxidoreductase n=1 Tax=Streptomyces TaxID=1883 RepID=UPI0029A10DC0|nr:MULTISPECIES: FAD-dependent oxidoreductase [unclassified Streptomyces]MDX2546857.1 FAD-dependent oxidoreductase [Streptomyces sp. WI04-05B]MDX2589653.1 FAD-dependent oxidoreductase [Streptomyces sp. WI04-05A]